MKRYIFAFVHVFAFAICSLLLLLCFVACEQYEIEESAIPCGQNGHMHAVDLGLSVKWACCNVGADSPEEFGGYYAWGETEEKTFYEDPTYKWLDQTVDEISKYNDVDGKTTLEPADDAAQTLVGDGWRMPTRAEMQELIDRCTWVWTVVNGVKGYKVSGNGNSIFLPAAGSYNNTSLMNQGNRGCYLSSSVFSEDIELAHCLGFNEKDYYPINDYRCKGHTIRPVRN